MQIIQTPRDGVLLLTVTGRLDSYWADHLDAALTEAVREDHHHLQLDLSHVTFLSSAGIAVLMKFYKQLSRISGSITLVHPSAPVRVVLDMVRLSAVLVSAGDPPRAAVPAPGEIRRIERDGVAFDVRALAAEGGLRGRALGQNVSLAGGALDPIEPISLGATTPLFALGVGAFGDGMDDCRTRFGELLSVAGATAYQPGDGTNVPDYLLSDGPLPDDVRVLHCLVCDGTFTSVLRFERTLGLTPLAEICLEISGGDTAGFVLIGEAAGLVGAALRKSPMMLADDLFAYPAIRHHLTFTAERAFSRSLTLAAGVVTRAPSPENRQLRPLGHNLHGHVHAAAFPFRPLKRGDVDLNETVRLLFEHEQLLGVLHLLHDDRGPAGAGESEFIRGVCWVGPLAGDWVQASAE